MSTGGYISNLLSKGGIEISSLPYSRKFSGVKFSQILKKQIFTVKLVHESLFSYPVFHGVMFAVRVQSAKSAKILPLKNFLLYVNPCSTNPISSKRTSVCDCFVSVCSPGSDWWPRPDHLSALSGGRG